MMTEFFAFSFPLLRKWEKVRKTSCVCGKMRTQEMLVEILEKMRCGKGKNVKRNVETANKARIPCLWERKRKERMRPEWGGTPFSFEKMLKTSIFVNRRKKSLS